MLTKDDYIQVINQSIAPPAEAWKNDPFEYLLKQFPKNIIEKYGDSQPEDIIPSTSDDVRTVNADARIQFSQIIGGLYLDLAALLKSNRTTCTDEYQLLSLQDVASIKNSFEFFILTGVLPFLEPGVGLPASARSSFIKSWKVYDGNTATCAEKLTFAAEVFVALLECNDALTVQLLPKYLYDVICVRFSLIQLKLPEFEPSFVEIFRKIPSNLFLDALMFLTGEKKKTPTPTWMKTLCGRELTKILVAKDGLSHLLQYYKERAGENWTDNLPMTKQVAWHLATVPRMFRHPMEYHERMSRQFFDTMYKQKSIDKNLLKVFVSYVEELRTRFSRNADVTIFDQILMFWEILNKKMADRTKVENEQLMDFSSKHIRNIELLAQIQSSADMRRVRAISPVLFACVETVPFVKDILKWTMESFGSPGMSLYQHVMTPSHAVVIRQKVPEVSPMIQEIGNFDAGVKVPVEEMWLQGIEDQDQGVSRRLAEAFYIVDNVMMQSQFRTIMDMMSLGLEDFLKASEKERDDDAARFVVFGAATAFSSYHAHLLVGCCFERLTNMSTDTGFAVDECVQLIKMAENILNNATGKFLRLAGRKRAVDVFQMTADENKEFVATRDTAKLALPMVSTIFLITQNMPRFHDTHVKALEAMANFTKAADAFPSDNPEFHQTVEEAKKMLKELNIDVNAVSPAPVQQRNERRRYSNGDICQELIEELNDDEPAVRGGTLMTIAKSFRNRSYVCQRLLEYGVYDVVKELIEDEDSYVYLAAINCLCEMALYDRRIFDGVVKYFEDISNIPEKEERTVTRCVKIAEALGKMFQAKGDISVIYIDKMANVFMNGMQEPDEKLRASSCGAFGNLLLVTRGRGVEKSLDKLFILLHNLIQSDKAPFVRRAAVDLIRQCLRACGSDVFQILRERLLELHREVRKLQRQDRDETVRLHAQLCIEEIDAALRTNQEETERQYHRRLRF